MRGQVFEIEGKKVFTMGGATSHDIRDGILDKDDPDFAMKRKVLYMRGGQYRINHFSWWKEEMPSDEEYMTARENLEKNNWEVDYIITHCCPSHIEDIVGQGMFSNDKLTDFFNEVSGKCDFKYWFFGHYHDNRIISQRYMMLYEQIMKII